MNAQWKKSTIYQIYPKSFYDSNGDGIGDIQGIISKLSYLADLGVDYLWITPMYKSPQYDNGYDIADYYAIDPMYGTMDDFDELVTKAHEKGLKIMMDIVVNHTSTEHQWFQEAKKDLTNKYRNYYIWKNGKGVSEPTNWQSKFGGSAWAKTPETEEYYLHLFDERQADLNWENEELRKEIYKMMRWWLEKGVNGFRLDVVNLLSKSHDFKDDTLENAQADGRKYYTDGPKIHMYLQEMNREVFAKFPGTLTAGEMSSTTIEQCIEYTKPENKELDMVFNFHHLKVDYLKLEKWSNAKVDYKQLKELICTWQKGMQTGNGWNALFLSNHDQPRAISRFVNPQKYHFEGATMLAIMMSALQGTPYIYQGEEFGMLNPEFTEISEYRDIEAINHYDILQKKGFSKDETLEILRLKSRDNSRTPLQWNNTQNAGFTTGIPWINVGKNYRNINAAEDEKSAKSIRKFYQKLIALRKTESLLMTGEFEYIQTAPEIFAYNRIGVDEQLLVIVNLSEKGQPIPIIADNIGMNEIILSNYRQVDIPSKLMPYEALIIKKTKR
ncbi:trehalose-6-P hydrolase [Erysipelotrichaceae bacterium]|nr:trehalose-6-P hydrolase [Erysipelotrichaceae bacterium]